MDVWFIVVIALHVLIALTIIGLVLLQHGKGADMGSGFGAGASASLFGATGSANFLSRTTAVLAAIFFAMSLGLAYFASHRSKPSGGLMEAVKTEAPAGEAPKPAAAPKPSAEAPKPAPAEGSKAKQVPN